MNHLPEEECSICWRSFSITITPMTLICGHSLCEECSEGVRRCPLCRAKQPSGIQRVQNYSLMSLIDKMEKIEKREYKDQEVQTEVIKRTYVPRRSTSTTITYAPSSMALDVICRLSRVQQAITKTFRSNSNLALN